ncbi:MAG: hypothetical protein ABR549_02270 [Mycobacteriales bacterium]
MVYAYLTDVRGLGVTYDKVDYLTKACEGRTKPEDFVQEPRASAICLRNASPLLRRVSLSHTAVITAVSEGDAETHLLPPQLAHYHECCSGPDLWKVTLRRGLIVAMYQFNVAGG